MTEKKQEKARESKQDRREILRRIAERGGEEVGRRKQVKRKRQTDTEDRQTKT